MSLIRRLAMLSLLAGLISCSHSGNESTAATTSPGQDLGDPRETMESSTQMTVTVDLPPELIVSLPSRSWFSAFSFVEQAFAAPVPGARMLVVLTGADGVVTKVLGPDDGLVVNDNGDGTYTITMPGDPTVNGMVVADPSGGSQIQAGVTLPDGTFYSPASGGDVEVSPESTAATRVALNYIDDFNGITAAELASLVDTLTRIAEGITSQLNTTDMDQLEADLTAATYDYLVNAVAQAKQDLLFDATGYTGAYTSIAVLQSMHTAATGAYVDLRTGYTARSLSVSIPLPVPPETEIDLSSLDFSYDADAGLPGAGALNSHLIQTSGQSRRAFEFEPALLSLVDLPVNYDGAIVVDLPAQSRSFVGNAAGELQLYAAKGYFYGNDQTIGGMFMSTRRDVFDSIADGGEVTTEIAIRRSENFDIATLSGNYGALISTTSVGGPLVNVRGVQLFNATSGAFTASTQFNRTTMTQQTTGSVNSSNVPASFGAVVMAAGADADGTVSATIGGINYSGISSSDGRLVHAAAADPAGTAGFATMVKLATNTSLADVSAKRYALFGAYNRMELGFAQVGALSGFLSVTDASSIQYLDDSEGAEFSRIVAESLPGASRSHAAFVNTQGLFDIAVNSNGSITFGYTDHQVQGFVQEGGDLLLLHDVRLVGTSGSNTHRAEDRYYYAICFTGCTTTPDPALFTAGGEVQNLMGSVVLRLNNSELVTVTSTGGFTFATPLTYGAAYSVDIATQPATQNCALTNGSGVVTGNIGSISVVCSNLYSVGGTVSGLAGTLVLQNGSETLSLANSGAFAFPTLIDAGAGYAVTIATQPANQICALANGSGAAAANVTDIAVTCVSQFAISGALTGLTSGSIGVTLGAETLTLSADGAFSFTNRVASGSAYTVSISSVPAGHTCSVTNGSGTAVADVTSVQVNCGATYSVGGTASGLTSSMELQINGAETVVVPADGVFEFTTALASGAAYTVAVLTPPTGQTCSVTNGTGTVSANVSDVGVSCL